MTKLKSYLKEHQITTKWLAKRLNMTKEHLSAIVNGKKTPSVRLALLLQEFTGGEVKLADLIPGAKEEEMTPLRKYLAKRNLSVRWFALKFGLTETHASRIVSGKARPSRALALLIEQETDGEVKFEDFYPAEERPIKLHPLKLYLLKYDIPVKEFAKRLGVKPSTLSAIINYRMFPSRNMAKKIEELTGGEIIKRDLFRV